MYTEKMLLDARSRTQKTALAAAVLAGLGIALLVAALILRIKLLAFIGLVIPVMAGFFFYDMYCAPNLRYSRYLADLLEGTSHQARGLVTGVSDQTKVSEEGVRVYDVLVRLEGEERDTLFYRDHRLPLEELPRDRQVELIAYGRYIKNVAAL